MELRDIEYPLPAPLAKLLGALVDIAKRNDVLIVDYTLIRSGKGTWEYQLRDHSRQEPVIISGLQGRQPVESLQMLGLVEELGNNSVFLYPVAFERVKYERKGRFGKWWARVLLRRRDAVLAVITTATFILVILQIAELVGLL
jgi:hypothetical protein